MHRSLAQAFSLVMLSLTSLLIPAPAQAALVGYWQFDSADPIGVAVDSAGGDHNGTFNGGAQASIIVDGTRGDVLRLNPGSPGTEGGYISVPTIASAGNTTWVAWVNLASNTNASGGYPMFMTSGAGAYEFRFLSGTQRPEIINGGNIVQSPNPLALNTWHQIVHTGSGTSFELYVDGVSVGTGTGTAWGGGAVNFGRRMSGSHYLNGMMDDVQIWNEALSDGKVAALLDPVLGYNATQLEQLFNLYDAASGSVTVGDREWFYATGLTGNPGDVTTVGYDTFLQLDDLGNGVFSMVPVPEPGTLALLGLGCCGLVLTRRRTPNGAARH